MSDYLPSFGINGNCHPLPFFDINPHLFDIFDLPNGQSTISNTRGLSLLSLDLTAMTPRLIRGVEFINSIHGRGNGIKLPFENLPNFTQDTDTAYIYIHTTCGKFVIYKIIDEDYTLGYLTSFEVLLGPLELTNQVG